jgi:hypothetical protein
MMDFGSWFKSDDVVFLPSGQPCHLADLKKTSIFPAAPRVIFNDRDPRAFVFEWRPGIFNREDVARYGRQLVFHPGIAMSIADARAIDPDLPLKIKSRRKGDHPMDIKKLPHLFCLCIVKERGNRGFRFDPRRLPSSGIGVLGL